ncbi:general negative regulator of transcription subunit 4 [Ophiostoma piceae UAMH 11346]|uniref:General negative regulator of transcription subunit 4 n=1 Tax=Ophiostoma piceae (strain UAMH 11346) TaxID=1262450 RepID=S3BWS4_OPHP1|nr:general negative regulator of transcription subunit 4 [Ophiostoma piceae UAMH 11346]
MAPQDTFLDDEEDTCPLCIEEFDLSDRGFRPCPCGYQICQFCFNNIKQNMNSLCPACRRPYDEKSIVWRVVTAEEHAEFKSNIQKNQKKRALEQRQKEAQKREAERENRKNLVGVRVVQKNLVYVTGLNPTVREDELLKTLRKQEYFGQYGNIQKISISNRKTPDGSPSLGIYITFEKKEEAHTCIQAVNGSTNDDRVLKAQLGTTKYCSAWLRHEQCTNRQCMFLHELGDEEDSYTRQDLSSMNSINTQRPLAVAASRSASRQQTRASPAVTHAQPMARSHSRDDSENGDGSALPAAASWARNPQIRSRRGSHATSAAAPSPAISMSLPVTTESAAEAIATSPTPAEAMPAVAARAPIRAPVEAARPATPPVAEASPPTKVPTTKAKKERDPTSALLFAMSKCVIPASFLFGSLNMDSFPPLFDPQGGEKRRALRDDESRVDPDQDDQPIEAREPSEGEPESSGSLALGGEPEDREQTRSTHGFDQRRGGAPPPIQRTNTDSLFSSFGANYLASANPGTIGNRSITPQQSLYSRTPSGFDNHPPPGIASAQSGLFQGQVHNRQPSRYGFANESSGSNSATIKLAANPRILAQQSSMIPQSLHSQQQTAPYYAASMPGPPPGLKSTGTPPAGFGQGFANAAFGGAPKDSNQMLQDMLRSRGGAGAGTSQAHDAKREYIFPSFLNQYPSSSGSSTPVTASGFSAPMYGAPPSGAFQDMSSKQKKKGKKHRHANTSSSGGSGLVDLADPSIAAQARLPHQQNNAGSGQGLFGSQAQGGYNQSMMYQSAGYPRW